MLSYTVLYSQEGYFLICENNKEKDHTITKKKIKNSFSTEKNEVVEDIIAYNFPATMHHEKEIPFKTCLRGLAENLKRNLSFQYSPHSLPQSQVTLRKMIIDKAVFEVLLCLLDTFEDYYSLFIELNTTDLIKIQSYLPNAVVWHVEKEKNKVSQGQKRENISPSLSIIMHLANNILGKNLFF